MNVSQQQQRFGRIGRTLYRSIRYHRSALAKERVTPPIDRGSRPARMAPDPRTTTTLGTRKRANRPSTIGGGRLLGGGHFVSGIAAGARDWVGIRARHAGSERGGSDTRPVHGHGAPRSKQSSRFVCYVTYQ